MWLLLMAAAVLPAGPVHVWEKQEIALEARESQGNPYRDVEVWVDLSGPGFRKRVHGFWDGGRTFRVRVMATAPGKWSWVSGSNPRDAGLNGKRGRFAAIGWTEDEKAENACRRGPIRATPNGHAFQYADGTPFFLLGDTWWSTATFRFRWTDDDAAHPMGPQATFKDLLRFRKAQGFNAIAMIAAFPELGQRREAGPARHSRGDGRALGLGAAGNRERQRHAQRGRAAILFPRLACPATKTCFRTWTASTRRISSSSTRRSTTEFPGDSSPLSRWRGAIPGQAWKKFYDWPDSYVRYILHIFARYQANNVLLSPIHFDWYEADHPGG